MTHFDSPYDLNDSSRARVAADWWFRHHAELEAKIRFDRLWRDLKATNATPQVQAMAAQAVLDEARHAERCRAVALFYATEDPFAGASHDVHAVAPDDWSTTHSVLYETVALCCVAETVNSALLTEVLSVATAPIVREAVRDILRDEVQHARLGWAHLASTPPDGFPKGLGQRLPAMLNDSISEALIEGKTPSAGFECLPHGFLSRRHRISIFFESLNAIILPGFERFSIDTSDARSWIGEQPWALGTT